MRPPEVRSGPAGSSIQPSRLTEAESLARTTADVIVTDDSRRRQGKTCRHSRKPPAANASLDAPDALVGGRRTLWTISARCPWCDGVHLHRCREERDAPGPRRAGCGRLVIIVVRRVYRPRADHGVAA